ncbi:MAG: glycosyltransferase [Akkermansiaceae bacterium]|nr:glycosyltransferase [Akkermansiaceae bacterium]
MDSHWTGLFPHVFSMVKNWLENWRHSACTGEFPAWNPEKTVPDSPSLQNQHLQPPLSPPSPNDSPRGLNAGPAERDKESSKIPFFSVIIPAHNVEGYIQQTIESVASQTWDDYEIIAVDDGSTDRTAALLDKMAESHPKLRVLHQKNGGVSRARNAGIRTAQGLYIAFLDGDDVWRKDHLQLAHQFFTQSPDIPWYSSSHITFSSLEDIPPSPPSAPEESSKIVNYYKTGWRTIWSSSTIVQTSFALEWEELFPPGIAIGEDIVAWNRLASRNPLVGINFQHTAFYRTREGSSMQLPVDVNTKVKQDAAIFSNIMAAMPLQEKHIRESRRYYQSLSLDFWCNRIICSNTRQWFPCIWKRRSVTGLLPSIWVSLFVACNCLTVLFFAAPLLILQTVKHRLHKKSSTRKNPQMEGQ